MNEIQKKLFEIFKEFDRVCKCLKIRYIASGGTMLGAIRHHGFIPWDDDMDFRMTRDDYDILINQGPNIISPQYEIQSFDSDKNWPLPFLKIRDSLTTAIEKPFLSNHSFNQGLWIDVFPMDSYGKNIREIRRIDKRQRIARNRLFCNASYLKRIVIKIISFLYFPCKKCAKKQLSSQQYRTDNDLIYYSSPCDSKRRVEDLYLKEWMDDIIMVPFEDCTIPVPRHYDDYLIKEYGNWHQIPPESKRFSSHTIEILDLNKSYLYYYGKNQYK